MNRRNSGLALKYPHELLPEIYAYSRPPTLEECDRECAAPVKQWRNRQSTADNPIAGIDLEKLFSGRK